jgi:hypothetical protein
MSKVLIIDDDVLQEFLGRVLQMPDTMCNRWAARLVTSREGVDAVLDEIERPFQRNSNIFFV